MSRILNINQKSPLKLSINLNLLANLAKNRSIFGSNVINVVEECPTMYTLLKGGILFLPTMDFLNQEFEFYF